MRQARATNLLLQLGQFAQTDRFGDLLAHDNGPVLTDLHEFDGPLLELVLVPHRKDLLTAVAERERRRIAVAVLGVSSSVREVALATVGRGCRSVRDARI